MSDLGNGRAPREPARHEGAVARCLLSAFEHMLTRLPDRAEALADGVAREGVKGAERVLEDFAAEARLLWRLGQSVWTAEPRQRARILQILAEPLASRLPTLALALCAGNCAAEQAIEALRISALSGGLAPASDPGGELRH
jgi:hypothetical protein